MSETRDSDHASPRAPRVALATYGAQPEPTPDDALLVASLRRAGIDVATPPWDDDTVDWESFDAVVPRSTWDYHLRIDEFRVWLERIGARLVNPIRMARWNTDKLYLSELEAHGVELPATRFVRQGRHASLAELALDIGTEQVVVKPLVSATAHDTWVMRPSEAGEHAAPFAAIVERSGAIVQRYLPEVVDDGEWSLVFFDGAFSHAVKKRPKAGDYRVQDDFGGTASAEDAPSELASRGARAVELAEELTGERATYARADFIEADGRFLLIELELIEPALFLENADASADAFALAIVRRLRTAH